MIVFRHGRGALTLAVLLHLGGCTATPPAETTQTTLAALSTPLTDECLALETEAACCVAGQTVEEGTPSPDSFVQSPDDTTPRCTFGYASRDVVRAGSAADHVMLGPDADYAEGRMGDDRLSGGGGEDRLYGDGGDDWLHGGEGNDQLRGGRGNDVVLGSGGNDVLGGDAGADRLEGGLGEDFLDGAENDDWILPGEGRDKVYGGSGDDVIVAYDPCELVPGETIIGGLGYDRFYSPLSRARLAALGVDVEVESIVMIPSSCLSSCGGSCGAPSPADFVAGCEAACVTMQACGQVEGMEMPTLAECVAICAESDAPPVDCDGRAVLDAQIACLTGSCQDFFECEVPSCD